MVVDADEAAHAAYEPGGPGFEAVAAEFGPDYVREGRIDRARLGDLVFSDGDALRKLNAIVHPLVRDWMAARTAEAVARGVEVVVHDVPLLYENGLDNAYGEVVVVYVPAEVQLRRLVDQRGLAPAKAQAIIATQLAIDDKRNRADHVIDNSGSREATRAQVERLWSELK